ncbi:MAG: flippase-like domain-containing protein [Saprospiraceae bacterium]|nr:flippase-like domain-containing protein [Saprospiraceae bacterium]MBP7699422.1 flippase-like domain-containing protein [Saprospiraceae bacterium]
MSARLSTLLRTLFFLCVGILLLYYVFQKQGADWQKLRTDFAGVHYGWIALVVVCFLFSNVNRVIRWQMLIKPLGYILHFAPAYLSTLSCYFANAIIPRSGELLRPVLVSRYEGIPFEKIFGTVAVDRLVDTISFLTVTVLGFILEYKVLSEFLASQKAHPTTSEQGNSMLFICIAIIIFLIIALIWFKRKKLQKHRYYQFIKSKLIGFLEGIQSIKKIKTIRNFILHSLSVWLMFYLMIYFGFKSFDPVAHLDLRAALLIMVFGAFGMVIPTPGGIGSYQFLVTTALTNFYNINPSDAFSFSNIMFFTQYLTNIGFGFLSYLLLPLFYSKKGV